LIALASGTADEFVEIAELEGLEGLAEPEVLVGPVEPVAPRAFFVAELSFKLIFYFFRFKVIFFIFTLLVFNFSQLHPHLIPKIKSF
jgi:hypothetical protein